MNNGKYSADYTASYPLRIASQSFDAGIEFKSTDVGAWGVGDDALGAAKFSNGAWNYASGAGVTIGIVDEGLNPNHQDFAGQYVDALTYVPAGASDEEPSMSPDAAGVQHGTQVAGVIVGLFGNGIAADGGAFGAKMSASHITYGESVDLSELGALLAYQSSFDVSNNSWGFTQAFADNFQNGGFDSLADALETVASQGRGGLGTAFVVAGGNSKMMIGGQNYGDDSNFHNFSNSRFAIAVGAHDSNGDSAFFSSPGTNILISAPGVGIVTASGDGTDEAHVSGTSFAAPLVSAAIALMLEVNPDLGYRDIQEILAITANSSSGEGAASNGAGNVNGGGMVFDREMGFGALDAEAAVKLARYWDKQSTFANEEHLTGDFDLPETADGLVQVLELELTPQNADEFAVDFVELTLDVSDSDLKDLSIVLVSPDGTEALIAPNLYAAGNATALNFRFSSVASWGENPYGTWQVRLAHTSASEDFTINGASLDVYGDTGGQDDTYFFTTAFARLAQLEKGRLETIDTDGGIDTLNFAAANDEGHLRLNMSAGKASELDGTTFAVGNGFENAIGTSGDDFVSGNGADNKILGNLGDDTLKGGQGDDLLKGERGKDVLNGGKGADTLIGGAGFDIADYGSAKTGISLNFANGRLKGEAAGDVFDGIEGFDLSRKGDLFVGSKTRTDDVVNAGAGKDRLVGNGGDDKLNGQAGKDTILGGAGSDELTGGADRDKLLGDEGADTLNGGSGADRLLGGSGRDVLAGGNGRDRLLGGDGNDRLEGGHGGDRLTGGDGNDVFVFSARDGRNKITDFGTGRDKLDLSGFGYGSKAEALKHFKEIGGPDNDKLLFDHKGTEIKISGIDLKDLHPSDIII